GSLGVERYVLLVEGKGSTSGNYLLDFKEEPGSCLSPFLKIAQPRWPNEAARVIAIQERFQGTPPALLSAVRFQGKAFVLRELQPLQDRVSLTHWADRDRRLSQLVKLLKTMGEITAWDHVRSSGREGSAIADDLIAFAKDRRWRLAVLALAREQAARAVADYR